jgi:Flp pilus assembly protein TadD
MAEQVSLINVRAAWRRVLLLIPAALALAGAWYGVRWCAGATLAEYARDISTAEAGTRLAPQNPNSYLRLARLRRAGFLPEDLPGALAAYERAAELSPHDYLVWAELGRARGEAGDAEGSVEALRRAAALAPNYAQPRWHLGNALLRAGRIDEGFEELRRAADADPTLRPQVFNLAWQVYKQDMPRVVEAVGRTPLARAQLIAVLIGRGQLDEALAVWATLGEADRRAHGGTGEALARALQERKQFGRALQVLTEAGAAHDGGERVVAGKVSNGGFEADIGPAGKRLVGWQVAPSSPGIKVTIDPRGAHSGARALCVTFAATTQAEFGNVLQFVVVEPNTRYRLSFHVRTEELRSAATLLAQVLDASAAQPAQLGASEPLAVGTAAWREAAFDFTTGPRTEAVLLRLTRVGCPDGVCPIFGKVWYDDFDLQRAGR